jgi:hypothetical protein
VFVSHTSELREYPRERSYVAAAEQAISAAGHVIVNMADSRAETALPVEMDIDQLRSCDVYVGLLGTRYGSLVPGRPEISYTELEFNTAAEIGIPRLVFLLDVDAAVVGIPPSRLIDQQYGFRQEEFRRRAREGVTTRLFSSPDMLEELVRQSLHELVLAHERPPIRVFVASGEDVSVTAWLVSYLRANGLTVVNPATERDMMTAEAVARISSADIVIGDITGGNPNTFYLLGMAQALGTPTILVVNKKDPTSLPTELARAPVIFYDDSEPSSMRTSVLRAIERLAG